MSISFSFGPERGKHFGDNEQLRQHFAKALAAGLNVVRLPRIAGFKNEEVEPHLFRHDKDQLESFQKKAFEAAEKIETRGAGMAQIVALGLQYDPIWQKDLRKCQRNARIRLLR